MSIPRMENENCSNRIAVAYARWWCHLIEEVKGNSRVTIRAQPFTILIEVEESDEVAAALKPWRTVANRAAKKGSPEKTR